MPRPKKENRTRQRRRGMLPDEYRKESVVKVERVRMDDEPRKYTDGDAFITTDTYMVTTVRVGLEWTYIMEVNGVQTKIPPAVFGRFMQHHARILSEQASDRARQRTHQRVERDLEDINMEGI